MAKIGNKMADVMVPLGAEPTSLEARVAQLESALTAKHDAEKEALLGRIRQLESNIAQGQRQTADVLLDQEYEDWKKWAALSAAEKTKLVVAKLYPQKADDEVYRVALVRRLESEDPRRPEVDIPTEHPTLEIPAGSEEEACGRYQKVCGISSMEAPARLVCQLVNASIA